MCEELKACPFGNCVLVTWRDESPHNTEDFDMVMCEHHGVKMRREVWQSRPIEDALKKENDLQYNSLMGYEASLKIRDEELLRQIAEITALRKQLEKMTDALLKIGDEFEGLPPGDIANTALAECAAMIANVKGDENE